VFFVLRCPLSAPGRKPSSPVLSLLLAILKWSAVAACTVIGLALAAYATTVLSTRRAVYFHYGD
jgi:hypothetical protein